MEYLKVKDHVNLVRDPKTNCIINTNMSGFNEYLAKRESKLSDQKKVENIENEMNEIKSDLGEIKTLLKKLLDQ